ncbi:MAG TPA: DUF3825 domain-containing protein [Firmicutes bacterium]|nr:DUF3825 domain-containing protein [Bacillota bacterium]
MLEKEIKKKLYRLLTGRFSFEKPYPLSKIALYLTQQGIMAHTYGYKKLKDMMGDMPEFIGMRDVLLEGHPHQEIRLHPWEEADGQPAGPDLPDGEGEDGFSRLPAGLQGQVYLPAKTLCKLNLALTGVETMPDAGVREMLAAAYRRAREQGTFFRRGESYVFDLDACTPDGTPVSASIKRSDLDGGFPWYLNYAGPNYHARQPAAFRNAGEIPAGGENRPVRAGFSQRWTPPSARRHTQPNLAPSPAPAPPPVPSPPPVPAQPEPSPVPPAGQELSEEEKREIYLDLTACLPLEEKLHMATVSQKLNETGHAKEQYGFKRMKNMLKALSEFVSMEDAVMNGVPQVVVTLHAVPRWAAESQASAVRREESGEAPPVRFTFLPPCLEGQVYLPEKTLAKLNLDLTGEETHPSEQVLEALRSAYRQARETGEFYSKNDAYTFEVDLTDREGNPIGATLKRSDFADGYKWFLSYAGVNRYAASRTPGKMLERFAFLGAWSSFLEELANKALPEPWDFSGSLKEPGEKSYTILKKYIQYTFYRLHLEDKICISQDGSFAAFNTGLVTPHYDDIYACFEESDTEEHATKWRFLEFCTADGRGVGKRLVDAFNPLPQPPSYFEKKEDLLFDLEKELHTDYDHILLDNLSRLPLDFLQEECWGLGEALELLDKIRAESDFVRCRKLYWELSDLVADTPRLFNRLRNRLDDAIQLARKQVRWNFKTAIPCYFPTRNVMSLMLPLALMEDGRADAALVVEQTRSGNYQGQTILTLRQAYIDGRLLCRPNSEWLDADTVSGADADDED